jgi:hypothetical protein
MNSLIIGVIAWWIAEGVGLVQLLKNYLLRKRIWYKVDQWGIYVERRLKPLDCPLCLGFWMGLVITKDLQQAVLCSVFAILTSKIMNRL